MAVRREGSLPRQNWVSVNSAGAFPASQYFLLGLAPDVLDPCLQLCYCYYLPILLSKGCCPTSIKAHTVFLSLPVLTRLGLFLDSCCIAIEHI